jgi:hypothetical protein
MHERYLHAPAAMAAGWKTCEATRGWYVNSTHRASSLFSYKFYLLLTHDLFSVQLLQYIASVLEYLSSASLFFN